MIRRLGKGNSEAQSKRSSNVSPKIVANDRFELSFAKQPIRVATFNVAMFSLAPAISKVGDLSASRNHENDECTFATSANNRPKSILKSPLASPECVSRQRKLSRSNLKVSINLPDNEISLANNKLLTLMQAEKQVSPDMATGNIFRRSVPVRSPLCFPPSTTHCWNWYDDGLKSSRSILEVLREVDADILALQDVKAEEEKGMKPLSDLAAALGMKYVFAESWAPEYGNAILSKWPIKRWKVQKIANNDDFRYLFFYFSSPLFLLPRLQIFAYLSVSCRCRNVLKATIDVPSAGEFNFYCTQLDHLDENWRMKQIGALFQANDPPHILAGGLNSLNGSDYSDERWTGIVKVRIRSQHNLKQLQR